jgi:hypothetical protein
MKLGVIPCMAPSCLLESLNRAALSAIAHASGELIDTFLVVTVKDQSHFENSGSCFGMKSFYWNPKISATVKQIIEILLIQYGSQHRIAMHTWR